MFFKTLISLSLILYLFASPLQASEGQKTANDGNFEAIIQKVVEEKVIKINGKEQIYQKLKVMVTSGSSKEKVITIENGNIPIATVKKYETGEKVIVAVSKSPDGKDFFYIADYIRRGPIYLLLAVFIGLTVIIGKKRGIASLIGLGISFFIIFNFLLPQILSGQNAVTITILTSLFIVPITFYLSHGVNKKTTAAVIGTVIALISTGILAAVFVNLAKLTGFASEDAIYLQAARPDIGDIRGLLLAGIIIGALGILDDITISQASIVYQLKDASKSITFKELYFRAISVGQDHISSMVNTLILVYTGAALPLLLLFINSSSPFTEVINYEIVAEEIVRTLIASIGLILAVPITTFLACVTYSKK